MSRILLKSLVHSCRRRCQCPRHRFISCSTSRLRASRSPLDVIFYGTDRFSLISLERIVQNLEDAVKESRVVDNVHVVAGTEKCIISDFAHHTNIPLSIWPDSVQHRSFDLGLVVSFGHLIPLQDILRCKNGILNVHGSLLPRWRGASPVHHALLAGDQVTGITIMQIKADKFDVGDIVKRVEYRITDKTTFPELYENLAVLGADTLMDVLRDLDGSLARSTPQSSEGVTKAGKPKKEDGHLCWQSMSSSDVDRRVRAFHGLIPVYTEWVNGLRLKLLDAADPQVVNSLDIDNLIEEASADPGSIFFHRNNRLLCLKCNDKKWVGFRSVSLQGRRKMSALDFFNGFMNPLIKNNCQPKSVKCQKSSHRRSKEDE